MVIIIVLVVGVVVVVVVVVVRGGGRLAGRCEVEYTVQIAIVTVMVPIDFVSF